MVQRFHFLTDCVALTIRGKKAPKFTLSWPLLNWLEDWTEVWESCAEDSAAIVGEFARRQGLGSTICKELHKAVTAEFHTHTFWFKHCRSDRKAVRLTSEGQGSVKFYIGGCPRLLRSTELVITGDSFHLVAAALVLPVLMTHSRVQLRPELWTGDTSKVEQMRDHCATQLTR